MAFTMPGIIFHRHSGAGHHTGSLPGDAACGDTDPVGADLRHHLVSITVYNHSPHISILCSAACFGAAALSFGLASFRPRRLAAAQKLA